MKLYHYTCLIWLPSIMRDGILPTGEMPVNLKIKYDQVPKAVNLTANGSADDQKRIWAGGPLKKYTIRMKVDVPDEEVVKFREIQEKYKTPRKHLDALGPYEERAKWFFVFNTVKPEQIVEVSLYEDGTYRVLFPEELSTLVSDIEKEKERAFLFDKAPAGQTRLRFKEGVFESWLVK